MAESLNLRDPYQYYLSEEESRRIFREDIVPEALGQAQTVPQPVVVFIAGQPGAGKTRLSELVEDSLHTAGGALVLNGDNFKRFHPKNDYLVQTDEQNASYYTSPDARRWVAMAQEWLRQRRANLIVETTMRDPAAFAASAAQFRQAGYQVEVFAMAVPEGVSRLGILQRYEQQTRSQGWGRLTATDTHDAAYHGMPVALAATEEQREVDFVSVWTRGEREHYSNELTPAGQWVLPTKAAATVNQLRAAPLSYEEATTTLRIVSELQQAFVKGPLENQLKEVEQKLQSLLPEGAQAAHRVSLAHPRLLNPLHRNIIDLRKPTEAHVKIRNAATELERE